MPPKGQATKAELWYAALLHHKLTKAPAKNTEEYRKVKETYEKLQLQKKNSVQSAEVAVAMDVFRVGKHHGNACRAESTHCPLLIEKRPIGLPPVDLRIKNKAPVVMEPLRLAPPPPPAPLRLDPQPAARRRVLQFSQEPEIKIKPPRRIDVSGGLDVRYKPARVVERFPNYFASLRPGREDFASLRPRYDSFSLKLKPLYESAELNRKGGPPSPPAPPAVPLVSFQGSSELSKKNLSDQNQLSELINMNAVQFNQPNKQLSDLIDMNAVQFNPLPKNVRDFEQFVGAEPERQSIVLPPAHDPFGLLEPVNLEPLDDLLAVQNMPEVPEHEPRRNRNIPSIREFQRMIDAEEEADSRLAMVDEGQSRTASTGWRPDNQVQSGRSRSVSSGPTFEPLMMHAAMNQEEIARNLEELRAMQQSFGGGLGNIQSDVFAGPSHYPGRSTSIRGDWRPAHQESSGRSYANSSADEVDLLNRSIANMQSILQDWDTMSPARPLLSAQWPHETIRRGQRITQSGDTPIRAFGLTPGGSHFRTRREGPRSSSDLK